MTNETNPNATKNQWTTAFEQNAIKWKNRKKAGFSYSVIAKTNVVAYYISKDDMVNKLTKDMQTLLNK
jgi:hypothetical protein